MHSDELAIAFMDLRQAEPGHVLVIPRWHVRTIDLLDEDTAAHVMRLAVRVSRAALAAFVPDGLSLWQSNGAGAMQEVAHVHLHLQPRRIGDGLLRIYPDERPPVRDIGGLVAVADPCT